MQNETPNQPLGSPEQQETPRQRLSTQLDKLKQAIFGSERNPEDMAALQQQALEFAETVEPLLEQTENNEQENSFVEDVVTQARTAIEKMDGPGKEVLRDFFQGRTELADLMREVGGAVPEDFQSPSVGMVFEKIDTLLDGLPVKPQNKDRFARIIERIAIGLMENFASINLFGEKINLLSEDDMAELENRRFKDEVGSLRGDAKAAYEANPQQFEQEWRTKYRDWLLEQDDANGKKRPRPTLAKVISGEPEKTAEKAPENSSEQVGDTVFGAGATEKVLTPVHVAVPLENGDELRLSSRAIERQTAGTTESVQLLDAQGTEVSLTVLQRENPSIQTPAQFRVEAGSGANSFTLDELVKAMNELKNSDEAELEGSGVRVVKKTA